jgi:hypothetical protein
MCVYMYIYVHVPSSEHYCLSSVSHFFQIVHQKVMISEFTASQKDKITKQEMHID